MYWLPVFLFPLLNTKLSGVQETNFVSAHTRANAATIGWGIGIGSQAIVVGRLGTRLRCRMCSTRCRRCKTICPLYGATSRRAGSGCEDRTGHGFSPPQARDPKQLTTLK